MDSSLNELSEDPLIVRIGGAELPLALLVFVLTLVWRKFGWGWFNNDLT